MGAPRKTLLLRDHEDWRLFTSMWLHSGGFHLMINLVTAIFVGLHLEQEFGPLRIGVIYLFSAICGSMVAALFLQDRPTVTSSGALFGLLGTIISALIQNWRSYSKKPDLRNMSQSTAGLFEYELQHSFKLRQKLDRPVLRSVFSVLFRLLLAGLTMAYIYGINMNKNCSSCDT
ncbi:inactive RHOMBOID-like protein 8 [Daucus carota subsp. sativus]|uniref:inactive RHOMBOID-like protein 8 n=1 Tax=Daucus carota subsp. sativus TaxID=79200 RepID=UPI0030829871